MKQVHGFWYVGSMLYLHETTQVEEADGLPPVCSQFYRSTPHTQPC